MERRTFIELLNTSTGPVDLVRKVDGNHVYLQLDGVWGNVKHKCIRQHKVGNLTDVYYAAVRGWFKQWIDDKLFPETRIARVGMTADEAAAYERGKQAGLDTQKVAQLGQPKQRVWEIYYCYCEYERMIDKVPSARNTLVLIGDATLGMITAIEQVIADQKCTVLSSQPKMVPA